jgi:hypothetical protein
MMDKMKKEEEAVLNQKHIERLLLKPEINQWEREFLESVKQQVAYRNLTDKQLNALDKIRQKYARK